MKIYQSFSYRLEPKPDQVSKLLRLSGCCRFVWNKALAYEKENYENGGKYLGFFNTGKLLTEWRKEEDTRFLSEVSSNTLRYSLLYLDKAFKNFFNKTAGFPKFKKKGKHDSFTYPVHPRHHMINEEINRIIIPKIGWIKYRNNRSIIGTPKNITVSLYVDKWYASVLTEREVEEPVHPSNNTVGIDMGVAKFATMSDGSYVKPINSYQKHEKKLAKLNRDLSRKVRFSNNWKKQLIKLQKQYKKITDVRNDFLHKLTTKLCNDNSTIILEDLQVKRLAKSAKGTIKNPGHNIKLKSKLNKSIMDQGWTKFREQLEYKMAWRGGKVVAVPPQYTSQKCSRCGHVDKNNRKSQEIFKCTACGFEENADYNASLNILAAGRAVIACGEERV